MQAKRLSTDVVARGSTVKDGLALSFRDLPPPSPLGDPNAPIHPLEKSQEFRAVQRQGLNRIQALHVVATRHHAMGNLKAARELMSKASDLGDGEATQLVAQMYQDGEGVPVQLAVAAKWFKRGASYDHADCCSHLGLMHQEGTGVKRDLVKAKELFEKGTALGGGFAAFNLACMHHQAIGMPRNMDLAIKFYTIAAKRNVEPAMYNLARRYLLGDGVAKDAVLGEKWMRKAASHGHISASQIVAQMDYCKKNGYQMDF